MAKTEIRKKSSLRRRAGSLARIALTIAILFVLVRFVGWQQLAAALKQTEWSWLIVMYAMTLVTFVLNSAMLKFILLKGGLTVSLRRILMANSLSTFYTFLLPSDVLAGVAKWADLSAATGEKSRVLSALVFAKIALALAPLFFGTLALAISNPFPTLPLPVISGALCVLIVSGTFLILNPKSGGFIERKVQAVAKRLPDVVKKPISSILDSLSYFRTLSLADHLAILSFSIAVFVTSLIGFSFAVRAAGENVAFSILAWISMTLFIVRLFPITISNLGVREGLMIWALGLFGIAGGPALLVGLLMFSNTIIIGIAGAAYQLALAYGWAKWRPSDSRT